MSARDDYPLNSRSRVPQLVWERMCDEIDRLRSYVQYLYEKLEDADEDMAAMAREAGRASEAIAAESFYAIRRTDGDQIGDYGWIQANGPDDWTTAEEDSHYESTEYEIVRMIVQPIARRTFGHRRCWECGEKADDLNDDGICPKCAEVAG